MQPNSNCIPVRASAPESQPCWTSLKGPHVVISQRLTISSDARDFICHHRPELHAEFETVGDKAGIPFASLLKVAANPPAAQYAQSGDMQVSGFEIAVSETANSKPPFRLGDFVAVLLRQFRFDALIAVLMQRGLLRECHCAARQAWLNALPARLGALLEPLPLTLAVLFFWLLFVVTMLLR